MHASEKEVKANLPQGAGSGCYGVYNEVKVHLRKKPEELLLKRSSVQRPGLSASNSAMSSATLADTVLVIKKGVPSCRNGTCIAAYHSIFPAATSMQIGFSSCCATCQRSPA